MIISNEHSSSTSGFTLIELSIVIIVIGLLIGGALVGRDMMRNSDLQSIISDKEEYVSALYLFEEKHRYLPGDFSGATALWGAAHATPATCQTTASTGVETCDGNGDGKISGSAGTEYEAFRAWQQLVNEEMITGNYSGVAGSGGAAHARIDINVPNSAITGSGFSLVYVGTETGAGDYFSGRYGHILAIGTETTSGATLAPILETGEASEMDTKYDDGRPGTGNIRVYKNGASQAASCATTSTASTAAYDFSQSGRQCHLLFITGF